MARKTKTICKPYDLEHHIAIARLILQEDASPRRAVRTITDQIGGPERVRAANFDRLYRNHLKNWRTYQGFVMARDRLDSLSDRLEKAYKAHADWVKRAEEKTRALRMFMYERMAKLLDEV